MLPMPLRRLWSFLLVSALLPAAPAGAAQAGRVEAVPTGESGVKAPLGSAVGGTGVLGLSGAVGSVPLLSPSLAPSSPALLVKPGPAAAVIGPQAGVSAAPLPDRKSVV